MKNIFIGLLVSLFLYNTSFALWDKKLDELSLNEKVLMAEKFIGWRIELVPEYEIFKSYFLDSLKKNRLQNLSFDQSLFVGNFIFKQDTIIGEIFKNIIIKSYPKDWIIGKISSISQTSQISINGDAWAACFSDDCYSKISFFMPSFSKSAYDNIHFVLSHEISHANDWETHKYLLFEQRIDLLIKIIERLQSDDRYLSSNYVELIVYEDKQRERYEKAKEYWAEICSNYFAGRSKILNYKDLSLIESVIKMTDTNFDIEVAFWERMQFIQKMK